MRLVKRAAITVTPKQSYIDWANAIDEDGVKLGEDFWPERHVYLIGDVSDVIPFDRDVIVRPYFKAIFEEELNSWHRREREWPVVFKYLSEGRFEPIGSKTLRYGRNTTRSAFICGAM